MNYPALIVSAAFFWLLYRHLKLGWRRDLAVQAAREYNEIMKEAIPHLKDTEFCTPVIYARLTGIGEKLTKANG